MSRLLLIISSLFVSVGVNAAQQTSSQKCAKYEIMAHYIMLVRQDGLPMSKALQEFKVDDKENPYGEIERKIIIDAYSQPKYETKEYRDKEITEFANKYMLGCMAMYE